MGKPIVLRRASLANEGTRLLIDYGDGDVQKVTVVELLDDRRGRGIRYKVDGAYDTAVLYDDSCEGATLTVIPRR